jgi:hypothetical protein
MGGPEVTIKVLCEKAGALQGVDMASIVRQAYGPDAVYKAFLGKIAREVRPTVFEVLDNVIEVHDA